MNVIAVYPGRFHPLHKGHAASFKQLAQKFGLANTYLAISAKQEQPKSPFSSQDRAMMASALGIPSKNIMAVSNPYMAKEYLDKVEMNGGDPDNTMLVFGVSKKDMEGDPSMGIAPDPRFSFKPKKDGSAPYMQPYSAKAMQNPQPMTKHAYVLSTDVAEFPIAGETMRDASAIRKAYAGADTKKKMRILTDLYGDSAEKMKQTFDNNLQITESIRRLIATIKPLINEATPAQKAKFVHLLSEAKTQLYKHNKRVYESESTREPIYKDGRDIDIVRDLGNNYYLSKEVDEDDDVRKVNYAVYTKVPDTTDMYTFVNFVQVSPYGPSREKLEAAIKKVIDADRITTNDYLEER